MGCTSERKKILYKILDPFLLFVRNSFKKPTFEIKKLVFQRKIQKH